MKLSKAKLIKSTKSELERLGFVEFKNTISGAQGFFAKKINLDYYLTLGLVIHRYYESAFTGDYYFSKTTQWGACWGDIPNDSYKRPAFLLTDNERVKYQPDNPNSKNIFDIWWNGDDENSIMDFINTIKVTEPRLINNQDLIFQIENSKDVNELYLGSQRVKFLVDKNKLSDSFNFIPDKEIDNIPLIWFKSAEKVLIENGGILNVNTVKMLAADSYRQHVLDKVWRK